jgi:ferrochelatase
MRNWRPRLDETLRAMAARGLERAVGVILSALRTEASWDRYLDDVAAARARVPGAPEVVFAPPWACHPGHIAAVADHVRQAMAPIPEDERPWAALVFTAHSVPVAMAAASPYIHDLTRAAQAVVEALGHQRFSIAYQSRSGSPREPWLEPDVKEALRSLAAGGERRVVVVPIGFVVDHVEVLYDLDVEARRTAEAAGLAFHRAAAVNDHPRFIAALADVVLKAAAPP